MRTAILTDFISHDPAYSLCSVVANQLKMLADEDVTLFVRKGFNIKDTPEGYLGPTQKLVVLDPGKTGSNTVEVTAESEAEIVALEHQLEEHLADIDVVLTHDLIYQANMWKYHVAARRYATKQSKKRWLHWVHSSTDLGTARQTGRFANELAGRFPNSRLVAMHEEEVNRKGGMFGYERDQVVIVPNPLDIMEDYHPTTQAILKGKGSSAWQADIVIVYPARLDRGKQVEVIGEIGEALNLQGWNTLVFICDFHSTGGDKVNYRDEMKAKYGGFMTFVSDYGKETSYRVPHKVVMDLFDWADVFVHPSRSESDPLIVPEAAWKRNLLVLNFDLPVFRQYDGRALFGKFSSNIDVTNGLVGETNTTYANRKDYMAGQAKAIAYMVQQDPVLRNHRVVRQTRSLEAVKHKAFLPALDGILAW
jgi:glycosyltransferase involved in cell wall biosynthesis